MNGAAIAPPASVAEMTVRRVIFFIGVRLEVRAGLGKLGVFELIKRLGRAQRKAEAAGNSDRMDWGNFATRGEGVMRIRARGQEFFHTVGVCCSSRSKTACFSFSRFDWPSAMAILVKHLSPMGVIDHEGVAITRLRWPDSFSGSGEDRLRSPGDAILNLITKLPPSITRKHTDALERPAGDSPVGMNCALAGPQLAFGRLRHGGRVDATP